VKQRHACLTCGLLVVILIAVACGGESENQGGAEWRATIDTVGDTIVVRTTSGSVWGDTATLVAEVTIGVLDGADEYVIGEPRSIAVSSEGTIYLLDTQVPVLRATAEFWYATRRTSASRSSDRKANT
jgi:hypothetical protein